MQRQISLLRINPDRRTVAQMRARVSFDATHFLRRVCRANRIGSHELLEVNDKMLVVVAGLDVDESMRGWKLRFGEDTGGTGVLFGRGPDGGMVDCPVDAKWVLERITWLEGEDVVGRVLRAQGIIETLNEDLRRVLRRALPAIDGAMWLPVDEKEHFEPLITLGLATLASRGQKLTSTGILVHDNLGDAV